MSSGPSHFVEVEGNRHLFVQSAQKLHGRKIRCLLFDCGQTLWTQVEPERWQLLEQAGNQRAINLLRAHLAPEVVVVLDRETPPVPCIESTVTIQLATRETQSPAESVAVTLGREFHTRVVAHTRLLAQQKPGYEPNFVQAVNAALQQIGLPAVEETVANAIFEVLNIPLAASRICFDDVLTTLAALRKRGYILGIVTNRYWGGEPFIQGMEKLGLLDFFDPRDMAISADLGICKPHPEIFMHALSALNVKPEEAAMVGDSLRADIAGAQSLNIFAVWKPKGSLLTAVRASSTQPIGADMLFDYATERENVRYQEVHERIIPDLIIENLRDLLDVFVKVG